MSDKMVTNGGAPAKDRKCGRHCKRFWWVYLLVLVVITVIVVPVVILVAVPKIAQQKINEAKLEVQGINILDTTGTTYRMEINSTIETDGKIHAQVDPFEGEMYLTDYEPQTAFATLPFPKTSADKHQVVNVTTDVTIADMDAFTRFNIWFHNNETLRVTVQGKTKVKPRGLSRKYGVTFKKTLEIKGLNVFAGTEVTDGMISIEKDPNGNNFNGTSVIPNASHFTLDIGNVTFTNFVEDEEVGELYINDLLLRPGDNEVKITAHMDQVKILDAARKRPYCETGKVPIKLLGKSVVNNGQDLSYFAAALASTNQTVEIDIKSIVKKSLGADIVCSNN